MPDAFPDLQTVRDLVRLVELSAAPVYRDAAEAERLGPWVDAVREIARLNSYTRWEKGFLEAETEARVEVAQVMLRSKARARCA